MPTRLARARHAAAYSGATSGCLCRAPRPLAASAAAPSPPPLISIDAVQGRFFPNPTDSGGFTTPTAPPLFTEQFPTIDFNPPVSAQVSCRTSTGVTENSRPMVDVIPQADGSCTTQVMAGNGYQAGVNFPGPAPWAFEAEFTAQLTVARAGQITFNLYSDDGWILAMGPDGRGHQPTYVTGAFSNPPPAGPLTGYQVVGSYNQPSSPAQNTVTVSFPAAGTYPLELDYTECCGGQLALTLGCTYGNPIVPATISSLPGDLNRTPQNCPCSQAQLFWGGPFNTRTATSLAWIIHERHRTTTCSG